jgi:hypothetical protein
LCLSIKCTQLPYQLWVEIHTIKGKCFDNDYRKLEIKRQSQIDPAFALSILYMCLFLELPPQ